MENVKDFVVQIQGYDFGGKLDVDVITKSPFLNETSFDSLIESLASVTALPIHLLDKRVCKTQNSSLELSRISIRRKDDINPLIQIHASNQSQFRELKMPGIYLSTPKPTTIDHLLKTNFSGTLFQSAKPGYFMLGWLAQVGNAYEIIMAAGFTKLKEELAPHVKPVYYGTKQTLRRMPVHHTMSNHAPNIKKTFGP
ncbi:hypothetical protein WJU16_02880 [Chitinophaga pollutisoli]|uniref:Uncharacterized protein n=1 Tax=Chitinophaga pollutisoli TaxID=3133966 RepID=A0ABZ2YQB7_9BACT